MHIPNFKMPPIKQVQQLIQHGDFAFSIDLKDVYLHIPILGIFIIFQFVRQNKPYQMKVLPFGVATAFRVFTVLTKPMLFLC